MYKKKVTHVIKTNRTRLFRLPRRSPFPICPTDEIIRERTTCRRARFWDIVETPCTLMRLRRRYAQASRQSPVYHTFKTDFTCRKEVPITHVFPSSLFKFA